MFDALEALVEKAKNITNDVSTLEEHLGMEGYTDIDVVAHAFTRLDVRGYPVFISVIYALGDWLIDVDVSGLPKDLGLRLYRLLAYTLTENRLPCGPMLHWHEQTVDVHILCKLPSLEKVVNTLQKLENIVVKTLTEGVHEQQAITLEY